MTLSPFFIGRESEIAHVLEDLRTGNSVMVEGRARIGKRTPLHQIATRLGEEKIRLTRCVGPRLVRLADALGNPVLL